MNPPKGGGGGGTLVNVSTTLRPIIHEGGGEGTYIHPFCGSYLFSIYGNISGQGSQ